MHSEKDQILYPAIEPYDIGVLHAGHGHDIYYEQCGNRNGVPILFVHGGPGAGCDADDRRYFDPKWRVILFDQRGSGRSKPFDSLQANTTWALASDIWDLRRKLGINRCVLFGGSWGSTLSLVYSILYPGTVSGMVLRGIFLGGKDEIDYYLGGQTSLFFSEAWQRFVSHVPEKHQKNPAPYYLTQLKSSDPEVRRKYAYEWAYYELSMLHLNQRAPEEINAEINSFSFESLALMEAHFLSQNCFLEDSYILNNCNVIASIPVSIIQGRYDAICPMISAHRLHKRLPGSTLWVTQAGHSCSDIENMKRLIDETNAMFRRLASKR